MRLSLWVGLQILIVYAFGLQTHRRPIRRSGFIAVFYLKVMEMKRSMVAVVLVWVSLSGMAQESSPQKEVGLAFSSLNNFGLSFKTGTSQAMWRFNTLLISGSRIEEASGGIEDSQSTAGFAIKLGKEYRKVVAEQVEFRYGFDLSFGYNRTEYNHTDKDFPSNNRHTQRMTYQPGINLVLGLNYVINNNLVIGAELLPDFTYSTGKTEDSFNNNTDTKKDISGFSYGISNQSALLTLAYRF